ncbi:MAG: flagellar export chaperone FlgN [Lachnospiraceae bacterium]|nr:flagellar export chaperone FlgN [Lachnospiraceae bacterium]
MIENYLQVLEESTHKKLEVLQKIEALNKKQETLLKEEPVDEESFDSSIEEKGRLIDELNELDKGFELLYENIRQQLLTGKDQYKEQIKRLQELINQVTAKSVSIQAQEARNNQLAENFFARSRRELEKGRRSSKATLDYYRSMNNTQSVAPQFMDKKK